jgi:hypothetical protein
MVNGPQGERIMELMDDPFFKNNGRPVPDEKYTSLGIGFGNVSGQAFGESQNALDPVTLDMMSCLCQNPDVRFNDEHDPQTGQFSGDGSKTDAASGWKSSGTRVDGDVKTTTYTGKTQSIVVKHNTKENKITVQHLDEDGDLLVQQTHDSVGAARKELQSQGIDHKFYALRELGPQGEELRFELEPQRDNSGKFSMGVVAKFEHEDGRVATVTKFNDKFHVNVLKNGSPYLPPATYSDQEVATKKAEELLKK